MTDIDSMQALTQQMIDQVFSFGELGFQEFETSRYLTGILRKNGFTVTEGVAGMPTAWVATWGIRQAGDRARHPTSTAFRRRNQKPGVACARTDGRRRARATAKGTTRARR